jgi:F0F1-type ATP synthase epsilon subunit
LTIKSATKIIFQGQVAAVSFTNKLGPFDILPGHKNLIALVVKNMTLYFDEKRKLDISLTRGVVKVAKDVIVVYVGF